MPRKCKPLKAGTYTLTSGFGQRVNPVTGAQEGHLGLDYAAPKGTPFYAPAAGVVIEGSERSGVSGFGRWLWLDCQASIGRDFIIGHGDPLVRKGDRVAAGQKVGTVNSHGQSTGPHAHVECWTPPGRLGGRAVDPALFFADAGEPDTSTPEESVSTEFEADVDKLSPNDSGKRSGPPSLIIVHTNEGDPGGKIEDLLYWLAQPRAQASYHIVVGRDGRTGRSNNDPYRPWAAGEPANSIGLHLCFIGRASQKRGEWLAQDAQLDAAAKVVRDWSQRYGIPLVKLDGAAMRAGRKGIGGHDTTVAAWHVTDHTDPGPGFPWDALLAKAEWVAAPTQEDDMAFTDDDRRLLQDVREQLCGQSARTEGFGGWPQCGGLTFVDALATIGEHLEIPGFKAPGKGK